MRINVTLTFDVPADQAAEIVEIENGTPIREIVRERTENAMQQMPWVEDYGITVTLKK